MSRKYTPSHSKFIIKTIHLSIKSALRGLPGALLAVSCPVWAGGVYIVESFPSNTGGGIFANTSTNTSNSDVGFTLKFRDGVTSPADGHITLGGAKYQSDTGNVQGNVLDMTTASPVLNRTQSWPHWLFGTEYNSLGADNIQVEVAESSVKINIAETEQADRLSAVGWITGARVYSGSQGPSLTEFNGDKRVTLRNNSVSIAGVPSFAPGVASNPNDSDNRVEIFGAHNHGTGRYSGSREVRYDTTLTGNTVRLQGGTFKRATEVYGANSEDHLYLDGNNHLIYQANARGQRVDIQNGVRVERVDTDNPDELYFEAGAADIGLSLLNDSPTAKVSVSMAGSGNTTTVSGGQFETQSFFYGLGLGTDWSRANLVQDNSIPNHLPVYANLDGNSVTISGGQFSKGVTAYAAMAWFGQTEADTPSSGKAEIQLSDNWVEITGGEFTDIDAVTAGSAYLEGNVTGSINATGNDTTIRDGVNIDRIGVASGAIVGTGTLVDGNSKIVATGNTVTLKTPQMNSPNAFPDTRPSNTTKIGSAVVGVLVERAADGTNYQTAASGFEVKATDNEVAIGKNIQFDNGSTLAGAAVTLADEEGEETYDSVTLDPETSFQTVRMSGFDLFSGNKLFLYDYKHTGATKPKYVGNFASYHFVLPADYRVNRDVALKAGMVYLDNPNAADQHAKIESVAFLGSPRTLQNGDQIHLIEADTNGLIGTVSNKNQTLTINQGVTTSTDTTVKQEGNKVYLQVGQATDSGSGNSGSTGGSGNSGGSGSTGGSGSSGNSGSSGGSPTRVQPHTKMFSEGYLGSAILGIQAADLLADQGMRNAAAAVEKDGWRGFAAVSGSHSRYQTGSYVDANGYELLAGVASGWESGAGRLTLGAFFEAGESRYDTHNMFGSEAARGDGKAHYAGAGVLARLHNESGWWGEAALRGGRMHNRFDSDIRDAAGTPAGYSASMPYVGAQLGAGHMWQSGSVQADVYGQYLYARQGGKEVALNTGDVIRFSAVNSQRARVGARVLWQAYAKAQPYFGLAYEREFSGKAAAQTAGLPVAEPSLKGSSVRADAGVRVVPSDNWQIQAGITGYTGKRREISGSLKAQYRF